MSARQAVVNDPLTAGPSVVPVAAAVGGGLLLLLGRQLVHSVPALVLIFGGVLLVAILPPTRPDAAAFPIAAVAAVGVSLILIAAWMERPSVPAPVAAWALPLNLVAAVAEEAFFRRLLFGGLRRWGVAAAIVGSAVAFAAMHVPLYGLPVFWVDLGAGLLFGWQRWASGGWAAPAATHAAANVLAVLR